MAEALALKVIPSFVEGVIGSNLSNLASKEVGLLLGVRKEITYIIEELEMMKAFLKNAEERQDIDSMAKMWVQRVREVSLDMENCLDKVQIYLKRRPNSKFLDWLGYRLHSLRTLRVRHEIAVEIQDLKYRIGYISDCRLRYGIVAAASRSNNFTSSATSLFVDHRLVALFMQEAQLVGIEEPRKKLIKLLIEDQQSRIRVISVLGMGGLGKTTLSKMVYDDPQMAGGHFDCCAWTIVSQSFNLNKLLIDIIRQVSPPDHKMDPEKIKKDIDKIERKEDLDKMQSKVDLIEKLKNLLQNKRYFIVLDDIWNIDAWESIKHALPENNNGSKVIVTTRIEEVANNCCAGVGGIDYVYKMQFLSKEKSMELFKNRVFGLDKDCPEHLKKVVNDVVVKCGGLPLAIVAIAGVLASMPNLNDHQHWTNLLNNLPSVLETNPSLESMKQVLLLSYNHLPYLIKPCFLYLSIFPEDHLIKRKNLIQLWIAEGLVVDQYAMSAEVVAECYFNEIVSRSLILPSIVDWNGKVRSFQIHDVMLEVLIFKSMEENMVSIFGKQSRTTLRDGNAIRRLSLQVESRPIRCIPNDVDLSKVISLSNYDFQKNMPFLANDFLMIPALLPRLKLLRVLVLEYHAFSNHSDNVGFFRILSKLRHLRYLSLKGTELGCYEVKLNSTFSKPLCKLQNLVTLDIRDVRIPLLYSRSSITLKRLPLMLKSEDLYWMKIGVLRNLKVLQTLVGLEIKNIEMAKELGFLTQLRMLKISTESEPPEIISFLCVSLEKLSESLLSLSLTALGTGLEPPENLNLDINNFPHLLQSFKLRGGFKLPNWVSSLSNLAKLTFTINAKQLDNDLGVMKTLPNLRCLTLTGFYYKSIELLLFAAGGFRNLMMLQIYEMDELRSIEFQVGCMPVLKKLVIKDCKELTRVFDIEFLPFLQEIQHQSVPKEIIEELQLNAEKHKNIPKLTAIEPKKNRW